VYTQPGHFGSKRSLLQGGFRPEREAIVMKMIDFVLDLRAGTGGRQAFRQVLVSLPDALPKRILSLYVLHIAA
jgi:hypothetical protein